MRWLVARRVAVMDVYDSPDVPEHDNTQPTVTRSRTTCTAWGKWLRDSMTHASHHLQRRGREGRVHHSMGSGNFPGQSREGGHVGHLAIRVLGMMK